MGCNNLSMSQCWINWVCKTNLLESMSCRVRKKNLWVDGIALARFYQILMWNRPLKHEDKILKACWNSRDQTVILIYELGLITFFFEYTCKTYVALIWISLYGMWRQYQNYSEEKWHYKTVVNLSHFLHQTWRQAATNHPGVGVFCLNIWNDCTNDMTTYRCIVLERSRWT